MSCKLPAREMISLPSVEEWHWYVLQCSSLGSTAPCAELSGAPRLPLTVRDDTPTDMIASKHQPPHDRRHTTHTTSKDSVSLLSLIVSQSVSDKQTQPIASFSLTAMMDHLSTTTSNQGWKGWWSHTWALTWTHLLYSPFSFLLFHTHTHI